jgi:hypothetical protein
MGSVSTSSSLTPPRSLVASARLDARVTIFGFGAAAVGAVVWGVAFASDRGGALASYLFAFCCVFTLVIGVVLLLVVAELTGASWFTPLRPFVLRVAGAVPALAVVAVPVLLSVHTLYTWTTPASLPTDSRVRVLRAAAWLNEPFFIVRAIVYLATWIVASEALRRSKHRKVGRASAVCVAVGVTFTFASFDWIMSLEPGWFSTVYGVYVFAGGFLSALALIGIIRAVVVRHGRAVDVSHANPSLVALAKLLLTFSMFWAYIAFSQYIIVWSADLPSEVTWYVHRTTGAWAAFALVVAAGQFAVPVLLLLPYVLKRNSVVVFSIACWLLVMHVLDCYWLVMPAFHGGALHVQIADIAALLLVGGIVTGVAAVRPAPSGVSTL